MDNFTNKTRVNIWAIFFMVVSFLSGIVSAINSPEKYSFVFVLPLAFSFLSLIFNHCYSLFGKSVTGTLFLIFLFIKNTITPFFMALGDGSFRAVCDTRVYMTGGIMLELYEMIVLFVILHINRNKLLDSINIRYNGRFSYKNANIRMLGILVVVCFLIAGLELFRHPQLISFFSIGISGDKSTNIANTVLKIQMKSSVPTLEYYLFTFFASLLRWAIPMFVIVKEYTSNNHYNFRKILVSYIVIGLSTALTTDTVAVSLLVFISFSYALIRLYPQHSKKIAQFTSALVLAVGLIWISLKAFGNDRIRQANFSDIAQLLQAYFSGPENIAVVFSIRNPFTLNEAIGNIFKYIPYIMYFFKDFTSSNSLFNLTYWGRSDIETQIIPAIAQGARCFTVIGAPIFTVIIANIAIKAEISGHRKEGLFDFLISSIICVCFSVGLFMYSASLCIQMYFNYVFPISFLMYVSRKLFVGRYEV